MGIITFNKILKMSFNTNSKLTGRPTSQDGKPYFYVQDDENTMLYRPQDMHSNKYFGTWSKLLGLSSMLNTEIQDKYYFDYNAHFKANNDIGSVPVCFDDCVTDINSGGLSSDEKNCMRECYMKRISAKDDINMMMS